MLRDARKLDGSDPDRYRLVTDARQQLYKAIAAADTLEERSLVELEFSLVWLALGKDDQATECANESCQSAQEALRRLVQRALSGPNVYPLLVDERPLAETPKHARLWREVTPLFELSLFATLNASYPAYRVASRRRRMRIDELVAYLPFYNVVASWHAHVHNATQGDPIVVRETEVIRDPHSGFDPLQGARDHLKCFVITTASDTNYARTRIAR
jgi:hypothetical protein